MKTITVTILGWRERTEEEAAQLTAQLNAVEKRRHDIWKDQCALWDRSKQASHEERSLRRKLGCSVRAPFEAHVHFDGINGLIIEEHVQLTGRQRALVVKRAEEKLLKDITT